MLDVLAVAGAMMVAAQIKIFLPFSPLPLTLQTLVVLVAGYAVGAPRATVGMALYVALGLAGAPMFAIAAGFVSLGYLAAFLLIPTVVTRFREPVWGLLAGTLLIYVLGAAWMCVCIPCTPWNAFVLGVAPFVAGDLLKVLAAHRLIRWMRR